MSNSQVDDVERRVQELIKRFDSQDEKLKEQYPDTYQSKPMPSYNPKRDVVYSSPHTTTYTSPQYYTKSYDYAPQYNENNYTNYSNYANSYGEKDSGYRTYRSVSPRSRHSTREENYDYKTEVRRSYTPPPTYGNQRYYSDVSPARDVRPAAYPVRSDRPESYNHSYDYSRNERGRSPGHATTIEHPSNCICVDCQRRKDVLSDFHLRNRDLAQTNATYQVNRSMQFEKLQPNGEVYREQLVGASVGNGATRAHESQQFYQDSNGKDELSYEKQWGNAGVRMVKTQQAGEKENVENLYHRVEPHNGTKFENEFNQEKQPTLPSYGEDLRLPAFQIPGQGKRVLRGEVVDVQDRVPYVPEYPQSSAAQRSYPGDYDTHPAHGSGHPIPPTNDQVLWTPVYVPWYSTAQKERIDRKEDMDKPVEQEKPTKKQGFERQGPGLVGTTVQYERINLPVKLFPQYKEEKDENLCETERNVLTTETYVTEKDGRRVSMPPPRSRSVSVVNDRAQNPLPRQNTAPETSTKPFLTPEEQPSMPKRTRSPSLSGEAAHEFQNHGEPTVKTYQDGNVTRTVTTYPSVVTNSRDGPHSNNQYGTETYYNGPVKTTISRNEPVTEYRARAGSMKSEEKTTTTDYYRTFTRQRSPVTRSAETSPAPEGVRYHSPSAQYHTPDLQSPYRSVSPGGPREHYSVPYPPQRSVSPGGPRSPSPFYAPQGPSGHYDPYASYRTEKYETTERRESVTSSVRSGLRNRSPSRPLSVSSAKDGSRMYHYPLNRSPSQASFGQDHPGIIRRRSSQKSGRLQQPKFEQYTKTQEETITQKKEGSAHKRTYVPQYAEGNPTNFAIGPNAFGGVTGYDKGDQERNISYKFVERGSMPVDTTEPHLIPELNQMPMAPEPKPERRLSTASTVSDDDWESWANAFYNTFFCVDGDDGPEKSKRPSQIREKKMPDARERSVSRSPRNARNERSKSPRSSTAQIRAPTGDRSPKMNSSNGQFPSQADRSPKMNSSNGQFPSQADGSPKMYSSNGQFPSQADRSPKMNYDYSQPPRSPKMNYDYSQPLSGGDSPRKNFHYDQPTKE